MAYATNSNNQFEGTIISAPIRPSGPDALFATLFSNEIKGSHHTYETIEERNEIIEQRRDWGMLATVYGEASSDLNKTYQLKKGHVDTDINNDNNWIVYSPLDIPINTEWQDSVKGIYDFEPSALQGDRILVSTSPTGEFAAAGAANKIAIYNQNKIPAGGWDYLTPQEGWTIRVDNIKNTIFKYTGSSWKREVQNTVRYIDVSSVDNVNYTFTTTTIEPLDVYSYSVYYVNFGSTNSGTPVTLNIDSLGPIEIKKFSNGSLVSLIANDLVPGIQYQVLWNSYSSVFQTSPPAQTVTTIGPAEDASYSDGLYTDFTDTTPIGVAVDRFNEVLKALVPPSAPNLRSYSAIGNFVNGGISFNNSTGGFVSATNSTSPVNIGMSFNPGSIAGGNQRLGITSKVSQPRTGTTFYADITGTLNSDVPTNTATPTPAFPTFSFGNAMSGTVSFVVNGVTVSSIDLTNSSAIDTTSSGATSGISLTAATSSKFPGGSSFDTFMNRTGTYRLKAGSSYINEGYNFFIIRHDVTPSTSYVLNRYEFVADSSTSEVTVTSPRINAVVSTPGTKYLSGIQFYTTPLNLTFLSTLGNFASNTFNNSNDAITYRDISPATGVPSGQPAGNFTTGGPNVVLGNMFSPSIVSAPIPTSSVSSPSSTLPLSMTFSLTSGVRRINDPISFRLEVKRTVQGLFTGGTVGNTGNVSVNNWFIDTVAPGSSGTFEDFKDETYRLQNGSTKYATFNTFTSPYSSNWLSTNSIFNNPGHRNGLQVINDCIIYPKFDFSSPGNLTTNPNFGNTNLTYNNCNTVTEGFRPTSSGVSSNRTYTRYFHFGDTNQSKKFQMNIFWESVAWVNADSGADASGNLIGNNCWLEIKIPAETSVGTGLEAGGAVTGWMDATKGFNNLWSDGSGCFSPSDSSPVSPFSGTLQNSSTNRWGINFGTRGMFQSKGYFILRVTAGKDWTGRITGITMFPL